MDSQSEYGSVDTELDDRGGHSLMESQGLLLFLKDRKPSLEAGGGESSRKLNQLPLKLLLPNSKSLLYWYSPGSR